MTRRKKREAVFGMLLAVSTGINFAKAEEI